MLACMCVCVCVSVSVGERFDAVMSAGAQEKWRVQSIPIGFRFLPPLPCVSAIWAFPKKRKAPMRENENREEPSYCTES